MRLLTWNLYLSSFFPVSLRYHRSKILSHVIHQRLNIATDLVQNTASAGSITDSQCTVRPQVPRKHTTDYKNQDCWCYRIHLERLTRHAGIRHGGLAIFRALLRPLEDKATLCTPKQMADLVPTTRSEILEVTAANNSRK
ncbi:hypothetical protein BST61_g7694 [Cercospora zeina]